MYPAAGLSLEYNEQEELLLDTARGIFYEATSLRSSEVERAQSALQLLPLSEACRVGWGRLG